jgi:hypothetical protein
MYYGKIKKGNKKKAQWIMTQAKQAANVGVRSDPRMKVYYEKIVKRRHHNIAINHSRRRKDASHTLVHADRRHALQREKGEALRVKA